MDTRFKPGHKPKHATPEGSISIASTGYKIIKRGGRWLLLQRVTWEEVHGPIPKGGVITFIDGDKTNCNIDNLKLSDKATFAAKNTPWQYPDDVREVILLASKLKKKIHERHSQIA